MFIVSDKNWRDIMSLVPVSMWNDSGRLEKYPVLFYHEEESGFDADSVMFFLQQYNPKQVVTESCCEDEE